MTTLSGPAPLWTGWLVHMDYLSKMAWFSRAAFRRCPAQTPPLSELGVSSTPPPPEWAHVSLVALLKCRAPLVCVASP